MFLNKIKSNDNNKNTNNKKDSWDFDDKQKKSIPPNQFTVTSINQAHDLLRVKNQTSKTTGEQTSEEWLKTHSLNALKLTVSFYYNNIYSINRKILMNSDNNSEKLIFLNRDHVFKTWCWLQKFYFVLLFISSTN